MRQIFQIEPGRSIEDLPDAELEAFVERASRERLERAVVSLARFIREYVQRVALIELRGGRMDGQNIALPLPLRAALRARLRDGIIEAGWLTEHATPLEEVESPGSTLADYVLEDPGAAPASPSPRPLSARLRHEISTS